MAAAYEQPAPLLAVALSGVSGAGIVFGAVAGFGVARFGPRPVLIIALIVAGTLSLTQSLSLPFWVFLATRLAEGMTHLGIVVAAPVLMIHISRTRDYPIVMALWAAYFGVSFALVALILPILLPTIGLFGAWAAHGLGFLLLALVAFFWLKPVGQSATDWPGFRALHVQIYSDPKRLAPGLGFFWHTLLFMALITFLPMFTSGALPQPLVAGLLPMMALAGIFIAGFLARLVHPIRLMRITYAVTALALLVLAFTPDLFSPWMAFVTFIVLGVSPGAAFAAIPALNMDALGQAEANGAVAQLGNLGTGIGSPLFALAIGLAGLWGLLGFAIVICLAGVVSMHWMIQRLSLR